MLRGASSAVLVLLICIDVMNEGLPICWRMKAQSAQLRILTTLTFYSLLLVLGWKQEYRSPCQLIQVKQVVIPRSRRCVAPAHGGYPP